MSALPSASSVVLALATFSLAFGLLTMLLSKIGR